jgi:hypothetical protein
MGPLSPDGLWKGRMGAMKGMATTTWVAMTNETPPIDDPLPAPG